MVVVNGKWVPKNVIATPLVMNTSAITATQDNNNISNNSTIPENSNNDTIVGKIMMTSPSQQQQQQQQIQPQQMPPKAVLICRPNSHPFQERTLALDQPVKVGRSVARARATSNNAIFDCKVLSRHHALLWYENGKFYLQDTKSSNGTFVNNNRLPPEIENHEVSSGDIVQFGVDVIENNRKVTHGCIIATLKLYLPDGKEAKASPSIVENNSHVPLDELYKLHQFIQEATQREQCLQTKLDALQHLVDEARKSADESWQAYVGEERLLSRISVLETQLHQAVGKNCWLNGAAGEDRFREEILKLQEDNTAYQIAAKEALDKLHSERLQALHLATEQERYRISTEQELLITREQLSQAQLELEEVAQKLSEEQKKFEEERHMLEQQQWDLQRRLDAEAEKVGFSQFVNTSRSPVRDPFSDFEHDKRIIYDDLKTKEDLLIAENEISESDLNRTNGETDQDCIKLTVSPVTSEMESADDSNDKINSDTETEDNVEVENSKRHHHLSHQNTLIEDVEKSLEKHVIFKLPPDEDQTTQNGSSSPDPDQLSEKESSCDEKHDFDDSEHVDSKTLKYKYQSAQNELKKRIEILESILEINQTKVQDLEKLLSQEKQTNAACTEENQQLKNDLAELHQKWTESCNECQLLKDRVTSLIQDLETTSLNEKDRTTADDVSCPRVTAAATDDSECQNMTDDVTSNSNNNGKRQSLTADEVESQLDEEQRDDCRQRKVTDVTKTCQTSTAGDSRCQKVIDETDRQQVGVTAADDANKSCQELTDVDSTSSLSNNITYEQLVTYEEELVLLKQRYAQVNDQKLKLQKDLASLTAQYNRVRNTSFDKLYFYMAPLILMILYLVISAMIS